VYKKIEIARNTIITTDFNQHRNENSYDINGDFITPFNNVPVKEDEEREEKFSELPARIISLPDNRGIRQVSETKGQKNPFYKMPNGMVGTFGNLEAGGLGGGTGYYIERDRIYYVNIGDQVENVLIKMIASVDDLDEDDPIPVPAQFEKPLIDMVKEMMDEKKNTTEDDRNDSNNQLV